jgi:HK97 family phage prohead protease
MEVKHLPLDIEVKADGDEGEFTGYGSVFEVVDSQGDKITKGAFTSSLVKRMPKMLWQHDLGEPIGKWTEAREDSKGLYLRGKLSLGTTRGRDAYALMKDGALDGLSIGYRVPSGGAAREGNMRVLKEIDLWEVSLVTIPALSVAMVDGIKSDEMTVRQFEDFLTTHGFSQTASKKITACGFKGYQDFLRDVGALGPEIAQRDADDLKLKLETLINGGSA